MEQIVVRRGEGGEGGKGGKKARSVLRLWGNTQSRFFPSMKRLKGGKEKGGEKGEEWR